MNKIRNIFSLLIVILTLASSIFGGVTRKPYLQVVTSNSVIIRWQTDIFTVGKVTYGTKIDSLTMVAISSEQEKINHIVTIDNLKPATKYYYSVEGKKKSQYQNYFITANKVGSKDSIRIWVIADFGQTSSIYNKRRKETVAVWRAFNNNDYHANFVLSLGDQTEDDTRFQLQHNFFNQLENVLVNTPLYTVEGNHDNHDSLKNYYKTFSHPTKGEMGGVPSYTQDYYSFDYGNVHVVVLSTEINDFSGGEQAKWLKKDLEDNQQDWLIACLHRPFHSGGHHKTNKDKIAELQRKAWLPILEDHGVDLILQGHNHDYERSYLVDNLLNITTHITEANKIDTGLGRIDMDGAYIKDKKKTHKGTIFIEVAPGGVATDDFTHYEIFPVYFHSTKNEGSLVLDVEGDRMDVKFLSTEPDSKGNHIWDYFTIIKE